MHTVARRMLEEILAKETETLEQARKRAKSLKDQGNSIKERDEFSTTRNETLHLASSHGQRTSQKQLEVSHLNAALDAQVASRDYCCTGSLTVVQKEEEDVQRVYVIVPVCAGHSFKTIIADISEKPVDVQSVSAGSPIGKALLKKKEGDEAVLFENTERETYIEVLKVLNSGGSTTQPEPPCPNSSVQQTPNQIAA